MRLALALMLVCSTAHAQSLAAGTAATPLVARQTFEASPVGGPWLNASVAHFRAVQPSTASGVTMLHGLYLESVLGSSLLPWAFYAELRTAHAIGAGVVNYARLRNEGAGWGAASHSEVIASGGGTSIGSNVEMSPMGGAGRTVGINVQAHDGYGGQASGQWTSAGVMLQSDPTVGFVDASRYECSAVTGIHFTESSRSQRAVWIEGEHTVGLDVGDSPIRMNAGTPIQLESTGTVTMRYLPGRIEFRMGARVIATIVTNASASGGRLN